MYNSLFEHVALVFKLEAAVILYLDQPTAPTYELWLWKKCNREVTPTSQYTLLDKLNIIKRDILLIQNYMDSLSKNN